MLFFSRRKTVPWVLLCATSNAKKNIFGVIDLEYYIFLYIYIERFWGCAPKKSCLLFGDGKIDQLLVVNCIPGSPVIRHFPEGTRRYMEILYTPPKKKITWNLKMSNWKRKHMYKPPFLRFHVSFQGKSFCSSSFIPPIKVI